MSDPANVQILSPTNLIQCWRVFSTGWKKVSREFSETAVHDFRVAIRRMISELEIAAAITGEKKPRTLIRKFKRILKVLGPLREIQVHLLRSERGNSSLEKRFSIFLREQENKEVRRLRRRMQDRIKKDLRRGVWKSSQKLKVKVAGISSPALLTAIQESLQKRSDAVIAAYFSFRTSSSARDFHRMRIKFKRFRYAVEVAKHVPGASAKQQIGRMRDLQKIMGDIHDLQTYMEAMVEWSGKRAPVQLQKEHDALMRAFKYRPDLFEEFTFRNRSKPQSAK
jgi:CHAD domain-containing protein